VTFSTERHDRRMVMRTNERTHVPGVRHGMYDGAD
jgi:hypothetical protein